MRKLFIIFLTSVAVLLIILPVIYIKSTNNGSLGDKPEAEPEKPKSDGVIDNTNTKKDAGVESLEVGNYKASWIVVDNPEKIFLYSNLEDKDSAKNLRLTYDCRYLLNASFFNERGNHIGYFLKDGKVISEFQENQLFNGIFSISAGNDQIISKKPVYPARIAVQSGPILNFRGESQTITSKNAQYARRVVVAVLKEKGSAFFVIYLAGNLNLGPKLSELPAILEEIDNTEGLEIESALNLDGGSHSAFITSNVTISELSPIGSFFCIKD